jgi:cation-transporting ATPase 13A3/4/5
MTSINAHAQRRLRKKGIFCLNPNYINFAGGLDVVCFDKTGTLTEDTIEFSGVLPLTESFTFIDPQKLVTDIPTDSCISLVMGCCHSLVKINDKIDGDSLELQLFSHLGWELQPDQNENGVLFSVFPADATKKFFIHRQFPFESRLQRMTTIVRSNDDTAFVTTMKGAPEVVVAMCNAETVPRDWHKVLDTFTRQGCRVLGTATRVVSQVSSLEDLMSMPRNLLESQLEFAGFLVFQNKLKPETASTIYSLRSVDIRTVMVTGDNVLTAINVGRSSGMICETNAIVHVEAKLKDLRLDVTLKIEGMSGFDPLPDDWQGMDASLTGFPLSIEGKSFDVLRENDPVLFEKVVHKGVIFARMTPDQKLHLVTELQRQGHQVGMCGDGANDCGALSASNSGVSLSTANASVASPFSYSKKNIECFPILIMEGRGTLSATFGAFKYQACYCLTLLAAVMVLFWDGQKPSDMGYVFIDIILNILPPLMFGTTEPSDKLTKQRPQKSLFSFSPLFSIFSFVFIQVGVYLTGRSYLLSQSW